MSENPMQKARAALADHPKCGAHSRRSGKPCRSPAMPNGRCRMHGGLSPGAPRGPAHPNYKHGRRSRDVIEQNRELRQCLRVIREWIGEAS